MTLVLRDYLLSKGAITGPVVKNTSYSHLGNLKTKLHGFPLFIGGEIFLLFGTALHELFLENKRGEAYERLDPWDKVKVEKMVERLKAHPVVMKLFNNSIREEKIYKRCKDLFNIEFAYILDIDQRATNTGSDLKSTACKTLEDCKKKFVLYGYVSQGVLYKKLTNRKNFFFIFISKHAPYDIFILNTADFKKEEAYAEKELKFLTYFYKHYGNLLTEEEKLLTTKTQEASCPTRPAKNASKKLGKPKEIIKKLAKKVLPKKLKKR